MAARKKTTKATAPKRAPRTKAKSAAVKKEAMAPEIVESSTIDTASVKKMSTKRKASILAALVVIGVVLYLSRGLFLAASVNGEFVYRPTVITELEKRFGKQQLDSLITERLINQEAKKKNISVTDDEINAEITKIGDNIKAQGQDLDTLLAMQGMSKDELKSQVKTQKLVEKILADKVTPTDQEVADYIKTNKDSLPKGQSEDQIKATVKEQLAQQKLSTEFQTWLDQVKKDAKINYFVSY